MRGLGLGQARGALLRAQVLDPDGGTSSSDGAGGRRARLGACAHKSQYRGVSFDKKKRKWRVQIKARPRPAHLALVGLLGG
jgi:hypothetical protein